MANVILKSPLLPTCRDCLRRLINITVKEATSDEYLRTQAEKQALNIVETLNKNLTGTTPAYIATRFHPVIKTICRNNDPFKKRKQKEIYIARHLTNSNLRQRLQGARHEEIFRAHLLFSLVGNGIDFFREPETLWSITSTLPDPAIDESEKLISLIRSSTPCKLLFLADNAGEVFFDFPLLEFLAQEGNEVFYAVKGAPVQNDLCWNDLEEIALEWNYVQVVSTGVATVGLEIEHTSGYFQELYGSVDVIIGKGMGHFETMGDTQDERVFLMFQAKCIPIAESAGVPLNAFVIMHLADRGGI